MGHRTDAIHSRFWSIPASLASRSTASLHRVRHLPLLRFAFSGLHCDRALGSLSWPIRLTWPNHLNLLVLRSKDTGVWPVLSLTVVFLARWNHFIPRIRRRHRLSKTSSLFSSLLGSRPCFRSIEQGRYYNGIVNAQFWLETNFAPPYLKKLSECCGGAPNPGPQFLIQSARWHNFRAQITKVVDSFNDFTI